MASIPLVHDSALERALPSPLGDFSEKLASALGLLAVSPVLCLSAAALAIASGRSPLIAHRRVGWRGSTLWMLKLRTMWDEEGKRDQRRAWVEYIDDENGPLEKASGDPRVRNAFARFCRRHSIDELPQLLHVMRGEMSLVGPRPLTAGELRRYYGPAMDEVLQAKPGLAGLWQVSGRNRLTYAERRALDLKLVRSWSLRMYMGVLVRSIAEVWSGANTW